MMEKERMDARRAPGESRTRRRKRSVRRGVLMLLAAMALTESVKTVQLSQTAAEASKPRHEEITAVRPSEMVEPAGAAGTEGPEDWQLLLVNPWRALPEGYTVELQKVKGGHAVDARAYPDLRRMLDDCRAAGLRPLICSSYRSQKTQQRLYENKIRRLMREGLSREEATAQAGTVVAVPGTSEHQTGLAVDLVDKSYQHLDDAQASTDVQQWLMENSWKYGFVLRYPADKSDVTGIIYEPWHYRYVGESAAREMRELGLCLEEYIEWLDETDQ